MKIKYFDNAATTRVDESLLDLIKRYNTELYFNPSALSEMSTKIFKDVSRARETIAHLIGADPNEIIFTSCGTEGDNMAMIGALKGFKGNIVTSRVEHSAIYNTATFLSTKGVELRYVNLLHDGRTDIDSFEELIDENTQYVSLMHVNNETGAINDIKSLVKITKEKNKNALFICDGVQAFGKIQTNVKHLGVDFYIASGHKLNAPKGIGFIYHKNGVHLSPIIRGGAQESSLRAGTENVANIMAFSTAAINAFDTLTSNQSKYYKIKDTILNILNQKLDNFYVACQQEYCSPNILTLFIANIKTEVLLHMMEEHGFIFGTGSACNSKNKTSRVISALNIPNEYKEGMIRISFDKYSTIEDAKEFALTLIECTNNLRKILKK